MNDVVTRIRSHLRQMPSDKRGRFTQRLLCDAADEIERLLRGDFSEAEFQNLCHNFNENDAARFRKGCDEYQRKLFGDDDDTLDETFIQLRKMLRAAIKKAITENDHKRAAALESALLDVNRAYAELI